MEFSSSFHDQFEKNADQSKGVNQDLAFSTAANPFATVTSECEDDDVIPGSPLLCGLNLSFLHDWVRPAGETGNSGAATAAVGDGNDIFGAFDNAGNNTPSTASAFANFDTAWGEVAPEKADRSQSAPDDAFGKFDATNTDKERSPPRRAASGKGEKGDKQRARRPRRKSANTGADSSGATEGLDGSFNEMNVSNPDNEGRKPRRERGEGEKRQAQARPSGSERRRRPKEGEEGEKTAPRRNRSGRDSARTTS